MRLRLATCLAVVLGMLGLPVTGASASSPWRTVRLPQLHDPDGHARSYLIRQPRGAWTGPRPLLVFLPGTDLDPLGSAEGDKLDVLADQVGAVLVVGRGWRLTWAAGGCCGAAAGDPVPVGSPESRQSHLVARVDDVAYLSDVIASVGPVRSVAVVGFSSGGMLAARWACAQSVMVPVVSIAGPLLTRCAHRVDLLHVQGTADSGIPFRGGWSTFTHTRFPDTRREAARLPRGSRYRLVTVDEVHEWAPPGHELARDRLVWSWVSR